MEHKKDLTKIALAALILASASPLSGQADQNPEAAGTFLVAGCPAHGCNRPLPPSNKPIADAAGKSHDSYQTGSGSYQVDNHRQPTGTGKASITNATSSPVQAPGTTGRFSDQRNSAEGYREGTSKGNDLPANSNDGATSGYSGTILSYSSDPYSTYDSRLSPFVSPEQEDRSIYDTTTSRPYVEYGVVRDNTKASYDDNRGVIAASNSSTTLSEAQLLALLSAQGRVIYLSLDTEGKVLALQLASRDTGHDKDFAVKEAQRLMYERRGLRDR